MRGPAQAAVEMNDAFDIDVLVVEIQRYLAAVEAFRLAGCQPSWRREPEPSRR